MFDLLASADLMVPDAAGTARSLQCWLGVLPSRGSWHQQWPGWGFEAHWCRVARRLHRAPTHVEIIAPLGEPSPAVAHPGIAEIYRAQQPRPHKTHSTPVAVADLDEMIRRLERAGAAYRLDQPVAELPFRRLWVGRCAGRPGAFDREADGGLYLEFIATADLAMPILTEPVPAEPRPGDGLARVDARTFLTASLDQMLATADRHLGWQPPGAVRTAGGTRRARLEFSHVHSAAIEIIQPVDDSSAEARYLARWGEGPYGMRLEADDLDQSRARLTEHGVRHTLVHRSGEPVLLPAAAQTGGAQFELVTAR